MGEDTVGDRLETAIEERRTAVNDAIEEDLPVVAPERLYEASRYLLDAGGKRLRPAVLLLTAEALADVEPGSTPYREFPDLDDGVIDALSAAVSIEAIQTFTLIHDDIMDDDDLRRGVPAVHETYDTETAILAGDTLYSKAFEIMLQTGAPPERSARAVRLLATTCTEICEGQALDLGFEGRSDVRVGEYLDMVELKTAVLYGAAAATPGILLGASDATVDALHQYGLDIGRAFQIQDDLLDLTASSETLGKQRGSDLVEGKRTLVTLHARQQGVDVEGLIDADSTDGVTEAEIESAVATLDEAGSLEFARQRAEELVQSGKAHLEVLPDNEARGILEETADFLVERAY